MIWIDNMCLNIFRRNKCGESLRIDMYIHMYVDNEADKKKNNP